MIIRSAWLWMFLLMLAIPASGQALEFPFSTNDAAVTEYKGSGDNMVIPLHTVEPSPFMYATNGSTIMITKYVGSDSTVAIPGTIDSAEPDSKLRSGPE